MRIHRALSALLLAFVLASPARAVFATGAFENLRDQLVTRRDNDFTGTLTKLQKKQKKAVLSTIAKIDKPAADARYDIAIAVSTSATLAKAYPNDFASVVPAFFGPHYVLVFDSLTAMLHDQRTALDARKALLTGATLKKFSAQLANADTAFTLLMPLLANDFKGRGKRLKAAATALVKAKQIAEKVPPTGLHMLVDNNGWASNDAAFCVLYTGDNTLWIAGSRKDASNNRELLQMYVKGVTGPGVYPLSGGPSVLLGNFHTEPAPGMGVQTIWDLVTGTGTLYVDELDTVKHRAVLRFNFTGHNAALGNKVISEATLDVGGGDVSTMSGNGF